MIRIIAALDARQSAAHQSALKDIGESSVAAFAVYYAVVLGFCAVLRCLILRRIDEHPLKPRLLEAVTCFELYACWLGHLRVDAVLGSEMAMAALVGTSVYRWVTQCPGTTANPLSYMLAFVGGQCCMTAEEMGNRIGIQVGCALVSHAFTSILWHSLLIWRHPPAIVAAMHCGQLESDVSVTLTAVSQFICVVIVSVLTLKCGSVIVDLWEMTGQLAINALVVTAGYGEFVYRAEIYLNPLISLTQLVTCLNRDFITTLVIYWLTPVFALLLVTGCTCSSSCCAAPADEPASSCRRSKRNRADESQTNASRESATESRAQRQSSSTVKCDKSGKDVASKSNSQYSRTSKSQSQYRGDSEHSQSQSRARSSNLRDDRSQQSGQEERRKDDDDRQSNSQYSRTSKSQSQYRGDSELSQSQSRARSSNLRDDRSQQSGQEERRKDDDDRQSNSQYSRTSKSQSQYRGDSEHSQAQSRARSSNLREDRSQQSSQEDRRNDDDDRQSSTHSKRQRSEVGESSSRRREGDSESRVQSQRSCVAEKSEKKSTRSSTQQSQGTPCTVYSCPRSYYSEACNRGADQEQDGAEDPSSSRTRRQRSDVTQSQTGSRRDASSDHNQQSQRDCSQKKEEGASKSNAQVAGCSRFRRMLCQPSYCTDICMNTEPEAAEQEEQEEEDTCPASQQSRTSNSCKSSRSQMDQQEEEEEDDECPAAEESRASTTRSASRTSRASRSSVGSRSSRGSETELSDSEEECVERVHDPNSQYSMASKSSMTKTSKMSKSSKGSKARFTEQDDDDDNEGTTGGPSKHSTASKASKMSKSSKRSKAHFDDDDDDNEGTSRGSSKHSTATKASKRSKSSKGSRAYSNDDDDDGGGGTGGPSKHSTASKASRMSKSSRGSSRAYFAEPDDEDESLRGPYSQHTTASKASKKSKSSKSSSRAFFAEPDDGDDSLRGPYSQHSAASKASKMSKSSKAASKSQTSSISANRSRNANDIYDDDLRESLEEMSKSSSDSHYLSTAHGLQVLSERSRSTLSREPDDEGHVTSRPRTPSRETRVRSRQSSRKSDGRWTVDDQGIHPAEMTMNRLLCMDIEATSSYSQQPNADRNSTSCPADEDKRTSDCVPEKSAFRGCRPRTTDTSCCPVDDDKQLMLSYKDVDKDVDEQNGNTTRDARYKTDDQSSVHVASKLEDQTDEFSQISNGEICETGVCWLSQLR